jgi:hypothetical protein
MPGDTSESWLLENADWGEPLERRASMGDTAVWRYEVEMATAELTVRNGRVQSIDTILPEGVSLAQCDRVFGLSEPLADEQSPPAALVGPLPPADTRPRHYGCACVVVFYAGTPADGTARVVRFYAADTSNQPGREEVAREDVRQPSPTRPSLARLQAASAF